MTRDATTGQRKPVKGMGRVGSQRVVQSQYYSEFDKNVRSATHEEADQPLTANEEVEPPNSVPLQMNSGEATPSKQPVDDEPADEYEEPTDEQS